MQVIADYADIPSYLQICLFICRCSRYARADLRKWYLPSADIHIGNVSAEFIGQYFYRLPSNDRTDRFNHFFNWTWTYRQDSDIPHYRGEFKELKVTTPSKKQELEKNGNWSKYFDYDEFVATLHSKHEDFYALAKRPGAVAWIVSHCTTGSERERYKLCKFGYWINKLSGLLKLSIFLLITNTCIMTYHMPKKGH